MENQPVQPAQNKKPKGSVAVLILWLILFLPGGIIYALIRSW